ncbi:PQQ-dependent sugar dehydrogenase [Thiofaba sp. EF100]|uniref:PQQ-dependent sugar dehydrogenase n=1 Tax=Thiofaba sp. EF100 TaxID=3121274 RepID=UPI00322198FB
MNASVILRPLVCCLACAAMVACSADPEGRAKGLSGQVPAGCAEGGAVSSVRLERVFAAIPLDEPLAMLQAPGDAGHWYVVEKAGRVLRIDNRPDAAASEVFADIRPRVQARYSESGLLGMAFHPDFAHNGQVFLSYTTHGTPLVSRVSRFLSRDGGRTLDAGTETVLLEVQQPYANHNGGQIAFGPDGFLYIGLGDGGAASDPRGHGQNVGTLLGAMLRIDVDKGAPYAIPPDNPFAEASAEGGGRPEIYAWGLRNPWRWSFDRVSGELWAGDVGQDAWEEIDKIVRGGNYGWAIREGAHCYGTERCRTKGLIDPVAEYGHGEGCSVTGGYVYRGKAIPALQGAYLYGDFCSGRIWALCQGKGLPRLLMNSGLNISSFAEGMDGELYVLHFSSQGAIYRLVTAP